MVLVKHKFANHKIQNNTKILILGTFNPDVDGNKAVFFYGRPQNHLWKLLPLIFGENNLKKGSIDKKKLFMKKHKIDFADLIYEVEIEKGQETNYEDKYLDKRVKKWFNIVKLLENDPSIKEVYFTRKTFVAIPNMKIKIDEIKDYCDKNNLKFECLETPSRFFNTDKLKKWEIVFNK